MKNLMMIAAVVMSIGSASAFAHEERAYPVQWFNSVQVHVDGVCVDGDMLRTKEAVSVCTERSGGESDNCIRWEDMRLSKSRAYTYEVCAQEGADGQCYRWETVTAVHPATYTVPVYEVSSSVEGEQRNWLRDEQYDLDACK